MKEIVFNEKGLIPVIAQDYKNNEILMLAYMNKEAFEKTMKTGKVHYFSRSRNKLWLKGEESGNYQILKEIITDCDNDTLLIKVDQKGVACHTGNRSCFYKKLIENEIIEKGKKTNQEILEVLFDIIEERKKNLPEGSYTTELFKEGEDKILRKISEESFEVILASKSANNEDIIWEISDLLYHMMVLLSYHNIKPEEIYQELAKRRK
jgi:phosphoribosyl-ATP pyrophosphohydrolase/phosphoribosyl-AMP cyclohydrolase